MKNLNCESQKNPIIENQFTPMCHKLYNCEIKKSYVKKFCAQNQPHNTNLVFFTFPAVFLEKSIYEKKHDNTLIIFPRLSSLVPPLKVMSR